MSLIRLCAAVLLAAATTAFAQSEPVREFNVPPQSLESALRQIAAENNLQLLYDPKDVAGRNTVGVRGPLTPRQAVEKLLEGSGIAVSFGEKGALVLKPSEKKSEQSPKKGDVVKAEGIVVTAQKRTERLQDVPISISVLNGADLDKETIVGVKDALNLVPGVAAVASNNGGGVQITVRGVSAAGPRNFGSSPIAYYLDGVPFGLAKTAMVPDSNAYDLDRIEVLRGPQGTLFGASAVGGVVRVLTNDANVAEFDVKGRAWVSHTDGGGQNYRGDLAFNAPIVDGKLAARAVVGYEHLSGWIDSPIGNDVNDAKLRNFRFKVNGDPNANLSIGLSAWISREDYGSPSASSQEGRRTNLIREDISTDFDAFGIKVRYDSPLFSVLSTTSYLEYFNQGLLDAGAAPSGGRLPFNTVLTSRVISEEIVANSVMSGPWKWTAGAFYRDATDRLRQTLPVLPAPIDFSNGSKQYALFGEFSHKFQENLEGTLGLRYFHDDIFTRENVQASGNPSIPLTNSSTSFHSTTPRAVLKWHLDRERMAYASFSEGFRSGAIQNPNVLQIAPAFPPLKPDTLRNYEVGAKWDLGGKLSLDAALYYIDWRDVQQNVSVPIPGTTPPIFVAAFVNGDSASGPGVDVALIGRPASGLNLGFNFNWNDLVFDSPVLARGILFFGEGERLNFSSKYMAGVFGDYSFPIGGAGVKGRVSAAANYSSKQINRLLLGTNRVVVEGDALLLARASIGISSPAGWSAVLFGENLTNEYGSWAGLTTDLSPRPRPRTIGLQVDYRF